MEYQDGRDAIRQDLHGLFPDPEAAARRSG